MAGKLKLINNSFAVLITRLAQSVTAFVLTAAIARILGAQELGQYLLAFSYYFLFVNVVSQGLKVLFTRELARNPEETSICLTNGTLLQFLLSLLGYAALVVVVFVLPYGPDTKIACYIMGLTVIPFALSNVTEAILQAQERMHLIAISCVPFYILRLLVMIWLMNLGYGIAYISAILVISEALILATQWILLLPTIEIKWQIQGDYLRRTIKNAKVFFAIEGIATLNSRIQILILSIFGGELLVGVYGAIQQLMQPFLIISNSVVVAVFPAMSKTASLGKERQRNLAENIMEMLLILALPFFVGLVFFGGDLLKLVYGDKGFDNAHIPLAISAGFLILFPIYRPLSFILVANGFEKLNMRELIVTTTVGGIVGIWLISEYQLIGAAVMFLFMNLLSFVQYVEAVYSRIFSLQWWNLFRRSLVVSVIMGIVFVILKKTSSNFIQILTISTFTYCIIIGLLSLYIIGNPREIISKLKRIRQS
ncbi:MAG TPA: oligosaccharide flippase family protein [Leptolyngbyaceae cyanobacterium]